MKRVAIYIRVPKNNVYDVEKQKMNLKIIRKAITVTFILF